MQAPVRQHWKSLVARYRRGWENAQKSVYPGRSLRRANAQERPYQVRFVRQRFTFDRLFDAFSERHSHFLRMIVETQIEGRIESAFDGGVQLLHPSDHEFVNCGFASHPSSILQPILEKPARFLAEQLSFHRTGTENRMVP